ncbi:MAG: radical SAM protein [Sedimentisphaerales bacterium]|nr:radical SAM protein [Sedimentisphaerales bacterium]
MAMDLQQRLDLLTTASRFDLACACKYPDEPGRQRGPDGRWIYPAVLPGGRKVMLLKVLQTNACANDCTYCPFNSNRHIPRCSLRPEELAKTFMDLLKADRVSGLFLSSGVQGGPDRTMDRMLQTVEILRRRFGFKGYIHLKVIPGASRAAIEQAVRMATRVSVNIEAPTEQHLARLSSRKRFYQDIIAAMQAISDLRGSLNPRCQQTTQFVVGAAGETDKQIVTATARLYERFRMERVYFSAYQAPDPSPKGIHDLFGQEIYQADTQIAKGVIREHRLYQADFLIRRYGFSRDEIPFDQDGNLSLEQDPKTLWANLHPEFFPVPINKAQRWQLLRVPGIGLKGADRIIAARCQGPFRTIEDLARLGIRLKAARPYIRLD